MSRVSWRIAAVAALALVACGGGNPSTRADGDEGNGAHREMTDQEKFQAAHFQACEFMCDMLTRCSRVSLKEHWDELSEEDREIAKQIGPETLERHTAECTGDCQASDPSVRQVQAVRSCLTGMPTQDDPTAQQCEQFVQCLQQAQPRPR